MPQTLLTGATGLLAHQRKLDVVANNIANINTTSYKSQRVLFSDLIYSDNRAAVGSDNGLFGGTNPQQTGNGVGVAQVSKNFTQGVLSNTGESFDFAIQGDGFFVVDGAETAFTRDGSFSVDGNGMLVDPATGSFVRRFGTVGEGLDGDPAFQVSGNQGIFVPMGASVPGKETTVSSFLGNLPASATPPVQEVLLTASPLTTAGGAADLTTLLNDLDINGVDYQAGDSVTLAGTNVDGSSFNFSMPVDGTSSLGDLIAALNGQLVGATAAVTAEGNLSVTADEEGESFLSVNLSDGDTNVGQTDFDQSVLVVATDGKDGDTFRSTIQVFDSRGAAHALQVSFVKQGDNTWDANFESNDPDVVVTDGLISEIVFNEDGTFQTVNGVANGDINIQLDNATLSEQQTIEFSLDRMTHLATNYAATFEQDGFPPGTIVAIDVSPEGILTGISSNGRRSEVAQLAVAKFANNHGLESAGSNYYSQTSNSGLPTISTAQANGSGQIRGGQLETSNVDVALEFTQLIVAQRGFSANARTITVATEVLQELNNIFR